MLPWISCERSLLFRFPSREKIPCFRGKKYHLSRYYKKDHVSVRSSLKIPSFQNIWSKYHISVLLFFFFFFFFFFLRKIIFHFPSRGKIIFSGKRNINARKIKSQRDFFGKTILSGRLEKENMVFRAVLMLFYENVLSSKWLIVKHQILSKSIKLANY